MDVWPRTPGRARRVAASGGVELAATEYGAAGAPPLILLHGIGSRGLSWWPVIDALATDFRLIVFDLRGHGASAKPPAGYLLPDYAADLAAALVALDIERPALLGHSLGGLVALQWASNHPAQAAALAVEDPPLRTAPGVLELFDGWQHLAALPLAEAAAYFRTEHPDWSAEDCWRRAESITATAPGVFAELRADAAARLGGAADRLDVLSTIRSPVMLIHGDADAGGMVAAEDAADFQVRVGGAEIVRVPGAGHGIHRDHPAAFLAAVRPFLAGAVD